MEDNPSLYPTDDQVARCRPVAQAWFDGLNAGMLDQTNIPLPAPCQCAPKASPLAAVTNQFDNFTNDHLADEIGAQDALAKEAAKRLDALKDEAKRRGIESATGTHWRIAITIVETKRLDSAALKELLGDALDPYYKTTVSARLLPTPVHQQEEVS